MENINNENINLKIDYRRESIIRIIKYIIAFALSFFLSYFKVFDSLSPIGLSFALAFSKNLFAFGVTGSFLGYLFTFRGFESIRYIAVLITAGFIKALYKRMNSKYEFPIFLPSISAICCAVTGLALCVAQGFTIQKAINIIVESLLCFISGYVFIEAFSLKEQGVFQNEKMRICLLLSLPLIFIPFAGLSVYSFKLIRAVNAFAILFFSYTLNADLSALFAVFSGAAMGYASGYMNIAFLFSILGVVLPRISKYGQTLSSVFLTCLFALNALIYPTGEAAAAVAEGALSCLIFMIIGKDKITLIKEKFNPCTYNKEENENAAQKIEKMKNSIIFVGEKIKSVSSALSKIEDKGESVSNRVCNKVCIECPNAFSCSKKGSIRQTELYKLSKIMAEKCMIEEGDISENFKNLCPNYKDIKIAYISTFLRYNAGSVQDVTNRELRTAVSESIVFSADILEDLQKAISKEGNILEKETDKIKEIANIAEIETEECRCAEVRSGKRIIYLTIKNPCAKECILSFIENAKKEMNIELDEPRLELNTLIFEEKLTYRFSIGAYQETGGRSKLCGDSYEITGEEETIKTVILSDGMGTGGRAAVDSAVTVKLFSSLVSSGISYETALKIINSALLAKSQEETLATLDVAALNPFSGKIKIYKAGGAPSFIKNENRIFSLSHSSLPAGILRNIEFSIFTVNLLDGDIMLMVSDGALCDDSRAIEKLLSSSHGEAQEISESIAREIRERQKNTKKDDLTVICIKPQKI